MNLFQIPSSNINNNININNDNTDSSTAGISSQRLANILFPCDKKKLVTVIESKPRSRTKPIDSAILDDFDHLDDGMLMYPGTHTGGGGVGGGLRDWDGVSLSFCSMDLFRARLAAAMSVHVEGAGYHAGTGTVDDFLKFVDLEGHLQREEGVALGARGNGGNADGGDVGGGASGGGMMMMMGEELPEYQAVLGEEFQYDNDHYHL
jgi:hypothetical protein